MRLLLPGSADALAAAKSLAEAWARRIISMDAVSGRSMGEFDENREAVQSAVDAVSASGAHVIVGAGNVFHMRQSGENVLIVHSRPWASRVVRIRGQQEAIQ